MNELALFAGIGGGILGGKLLGWRTVCAVERDAYCREILLRRQEDGSLEPFPVWDDVRSFDGKPWRGKVDIVTAGFPCQPFSVAGEQKGEDDERNMWPDTIRIIREVGPRWVLLENVPGLLVYQYTHAIFGELAEMGYDCRWGCISAASVGANHRRDRLWILADADRMRKSQQEGGKQDQRGWVGDGGWWDVEPDVGRVAHGTAFRMDRIRALGNAQVPAVVRQAWNLLSDQW